MREFRNWLPLAAAFGLWSQIAFAIDPALAPAPATLAAAPAATTGAHGRIPALTVVTVEILADLGSKTSQTGQTFPLRLAKPILVGGAELIPAGTAGEGEVIWAKKSGGSGSSGELVLAARWLTVNGRRLRLRSMHLSPVGDDKFKTVQTINVATAATVPALSLVGFFISGKQAMVARGTLADAKTAEDFDLAQPTGDQGVKTGEGTLPQAPKGEEKPDEHA